MKRFKVLSVIFLLMFLAGTSLAASPSTLKPNVWNADQTFNQGAIFDGDVDLTDATITGTGTISATIIADVVRYFQLPLMSFIIHDGTISLPSASTTPGIEVDDLIPALVWADGEATPVSITFRVPDDYASGGAFKVFATESDSTSPNQIDFLVYVNKDALAADAAATDQTPAALDQNTATGSEVTLTVATDFSALAAGHWVTLNIWRDDTADGTGDLEVKGVVFYYTATQ